MEGGRIIIESWLVRYISNRFESTNSVGYGTSCFSVEAKYEWKEKKRKKPTSTARSENAYSHARGVIRMRGEGQSTRPNFMAPHRTASHRTAPHRTALHRTAQYSTAFRRTTCFVRGDTRWESGEGLRVKGQGELKEG
uniref:Uncharacterized protein n=1 Tax=Vespula pensylvanica TaxID=30213 RepID=A0A834UHK2_VESPE|nr:hypothetical protein H0235_001609 [Vespula pensylvanica]